MSDGDTPTRATFPALLTEQDLDDINAVAEHWSDLRVLFLSILCADSERLKQRILHPPDGVQAFMWGLDQLDKLLTWHDREAQLLCLAGVRI